MKKQKIIKWQKDNPVNLIVKSTGGSPANKMQETMAVWFPGQNYLYPWEIDLFIKGLKEAKEFIDKNNPQALKLPLETKKEMDNFFKSNEIVRKIFGVKNGND